MLKILPRFCLFCQHPCSRSQRYLCETCEAALPWNQNPTDPNTTAVFSYEAPFIQFISRLKFQRKLLYAKVIADLMGNYFKKITVSARPDYLLPVPLHTKRLRQRGFNQALEIAKILGKTLQIPVSRDHIIRQKATQPQSELTAKERQHNVKNAFTVRIPLKAQHVAIIDDVITTGNTVNELIKTLKTQDIEKISVWCCARAIKQH